MRDREASTASTGGTAKAQRHKLDLYESVMNSTRHSSPKQSYVRPTRRLHGHSKSAQHVSADKWKTQMFILSQFIRDNRPAVALGTAGLRGVDGRTVDFDYTPLIVDLQPSEATIPKSIPWAPNADMRRESSAAEILDFEIKKFGNHMAPTDGEGKARYLLASYLRTIVGRVFDHKMANAYAFGSYNNETAMPFSDLDVGIRRNYLPRQHIDEETSRGIQEKMPQLYDTLNWGGDFICATYHEHPFPTVTAQHKATGIDVQLVAKPASAQDTWVQGYMNTIPNLWSLYAIIRTMFGMRGLVDPFIGGISGYGSFMMLVAALTRRGTPVEIHDSPSAQLLAFLDFWSNFDTTRFGMAFPNAISGVSRPFKKLVFDFGDDSGKEEYFALTRAARRRDAPDREGHYRIGRVRPLQPYMLCLQDPNDPDNDLGASCHAIKHILQTIRHLRTELLSAMEEHDRTPEGTLPGREAESSFLLPLVGRCHEVYAERRERMGAGLWVPEGKHKPLKTKRITTESALKARRPRYRVK